MPLYSNVLSTKDDDAEPPRSTASAASLKLLQDHLLSKKRLHGQNTSNTSNKLQKTQTEKSKSSQIIISESALHKHSENDWEPEEEYDPLVPNSYELLQAEYVKAKEQRVMANKKLASSKKSIPNLLEVLDKLDDEDEDDYVQSLEKNNKNRGTAIAPPPSLTASSLALSGATDNLEASDINRITIKNNPSTCPVGEKLDGGSVAAKIMSKMGYKHGQGLGKDEQGISSPLEVEKIGINSGRILVPVLPKSTTQAIKEEKQEEKSNIADLLRESTRVVLLQNMVGPGQVDDDLEAETKEECKKYGDVVKCLIYEIPNKRVPDDEAVRIFVEFRKVESAIKATSDLNGRYFGGRVVRASFYSVERFNKYELAP